LEDILILKGYIHGGSANYYMQIKGLRQLSCYLSTRDFQMCQMTK